MEQSFGSILAQLRRSKNLSQRSLAKELHISQALLCQYENGSREPGLPFLCRVCDFFAVSSDYLLGRSAQKERQASSPELRRLGVLLDACGDAGLDAACGEYLGAAASRACALVCRDEISAAEQAVKMTAAELNILRNIKSKAQNADNEERGTEI